MSQSPTIVSSNRVFYLEKDRSCYNSDQESINDMRGNGRENNSLVEDDMESLRGTGSAVGTTTIIEEEIETITTFEGPPDLMSLTRDEDSSSIASHRSYISGGGSSSTADHHHINYSHQELHLNNYDLNLSGSVLSVPFPELGVDVVDINYSSLLPTEKSSSSSNETRLTDVKSWEDNWLFQKKGKKKREEEEEDIKSTSIQFALTDLHLVDGPVNMYIPNPSQSESFLEHFPLEDLEELSERDSVVSLAFSTDSDDEKLLLPEPDDSELKKESDVSSASIDLLEEQISRLKIQTKVNDEKEKIAKKDNNSSQPSSGFLQFLMTHDSSDLSYNASPKTTLKTKKFDNANRNIHKSFSLQNGSSLLSNEPQVLEAPSFIPLNRRITECPKSDPCFVLKPFGASVQPDILVQFCCRVKGSRPINVAWYKSDQLLKDDETYRIFNHGNEFVLELKGTKFEQTDTYSCCVFNSVGQQWTDFRLEVKDSKESVERSSPLPIKQAQRSVLTKVGQKSATPIAIVTRTWAERSENLEDKNVRKDIESESNPRHENSLTSNGQVSLSGTSSNEVDITANSIVSMRKGAPVEESVTSDRPIVYTSTPTPTSDSKKGFQVNENISSQKLNLCDQNEQFKGLSGEKINGKEEDQEIAVDIKESRVISSLSSSNKRNYYMPTHDDGISIDGSLERNRLDESMNGLEEKVYESSKFFTLRHFPSKKDFLERSSTGESGCESISIPKGSQDGESEGSDEGNNENNRPVKPISPSAFGPSVKKLVRRFSRKESGLQRRSTFTSSNSIHDEGRGSGIRVQLRSPGSHRFEVHSITGRNLKKEFRDDKKQHHFPQSLNRMGSTSLYDIDQVPKSLSPGSGSSDVTATTDSPTNGYISDDSTVSGTKVKFSSLKVEPDHVVEINTTRKTTTRTEKEAYWHKRKTDSRLSDSSITEDYPSAHFL